MPFLPIKETVSNVLYIDYDTRADVYANRVLYRYQAFVTAKQKRLKPADLFGQGTTYANWTSERWCVTPSWKRAGSGSYLATEYNHFLPTPEPNPLGLNFTNGAVGSIDSYLAGMLRTKALLEIKEQKVNLSVSVIELPKTASMVRDLWKEAYGFLRNLRRGRLQSAIRAIKDPRTKADKALASRWLQYQYGVIPTIMEVNGVLDLVSSRVRQGFWIYGKVGLTHVTSVNGSSSLYGTTHVMTTEHKYKCIYRYYVRQEKLATLAQSGLSNPAATAWELVPYSFVFDWFVNVGDYLETLDALVGIDSVQQIVAGKSVAVIDFDVIPTGKIKGNGKSLRVDRLARRSLPTLGIKPYRPVYKPHLSIKRLISATALTRNLFK